MNTSNHIDNIPNLWGPKGNYKNSSTVDDITVFQNESVDSSRMTCIISDDYAFLKVSKTQIPRHSFSDHGLNLEQVPSILSNAIRSILDLSQDDQDCLRNALGFAEDSVDEADHKGSRYSNLTPAASDSSPNRDQLNSGWSFSPNSVSYNGHLFSIQGVPQKILKALSTSPCGLKINALIKKVWLRKTVNRETLGSHITSIRRCIRNPRRKTHFCSEPNV